MREPGWKLSHEEALSATLLINKPLKASTREVQLGHRKKPPRRNHSQPFRLKNALSVQVLGIPVLLSHLSIIIDITSPELYSRGH